jgi:hypothetical protein
LPPAFAASECAPLALYTDSYDISFSAEACKTELIYFIFSVELYFITHVRPAATRNLGDTLRVLCLNLYFVNSQ